VVELSIHYQTVLGSNPNFADDCWSLVHLMNDSNGDCFKNLCCFNTAFHRFGRAKFAYGGLILATVQAASKFDASYTNSQK